MALTTQFHKVESIHFDFALLRKAFLGFAVAMVVMAPFSRDPLVAVVCGFTPWLLTALVDRPRMPAVVLYYLLWMWVEAATRLLLAFMDGELLGDGQYGPDVTRAFWYSMANSRRPCDNVSNLFDRFGSAFGRSAQRASKLVPGKVVLPLFGDGGAVLRNCSARFDQWRAGPAGDSVGNAEVCGHVHAVRERAVDGNRHQLTFRRRADRGRHRLQRIVLGLQDRFHRSASCCSFASNCHTRDQHLGRYRGLCGASRSWRVLDGGEVGISRGSDRLFR